MKKRKQATTSSEATTPESARTKTANLRGWKLFGFRAAAAVGVPALLLLLVELVLRMIGYGYPTGFFLAETQNGKDVFVQNNKFGWRFFGPKLARLPHPFSIKRARANDSIRIFVLGESAAKGDPDPHFGLSRMLETLLTLRHPGVRFEVVNAAMTAINSHAVLPISRDCAQAQGDVWVIYMGNNEVVGPFGAGTVFGVQTPPLPVIRAALALKSNRTGQMFNALLQSVNRETKQSEWGGMEMFLSQQVRANDLRMNGVYQNFERNLGDILRAGRRNGIGMVVSTVAVNLRDCAPFGSMHPGGFFDSAKDQWEQQYLLGIKAQATNDWALAAEKFTAAAALDDTYAELRYRQGQCALHLGKSAEARTHFQAACDLDTLRFRCDSKLNELIRRLASNREAEGILLADSEQAFTAASADGLPGADWFYEHVHFTFEGNWLLASTIAVQVERLLADRLTTAQPTLPWPSSEDCARRLGWSAWSQLTGWRGVLPRLNRPPFTSQFDHQAQMERVSLKLTELSAAVRPGGISNSLFICETAINAMPDDPPLLSQLASLRKAAGNLAAATVAARRVVELLPSDGESWSRLGTLLLGQRQLSEATKAFRNSIKLDPQDVVARESLAQTLAALGEREAAITEFEGVVSENPQLGLAWLHYGQVLEAMGQPAKAKTCYEKALASPGQNQTSLIELAGFCQSRGWSQAAAENYAAALKLDPDNAKLHIGVAQNLAAIGKSAEATHHAAEAVRLSAQFAEARVLYGVMLGRQGLFQAAVEQFREALRLQPDSLDARLNLGTALIKTEQRAEALQLFQEVLQRNPTNAQALRNVKALRSGSLPTTQTR